MIVSKEQIIVKHPVTKEITKRALKVSYVDRNGGIGFLDWDIPENQMFSWKYTSKQYADPYFQSYDNKPVRRVPAKKLNPFRIDEILCGFGQAIAPVFEMNLPKTLYIDIETEVSPSEGFITADVASLPVNTIAYCSYPNVWVLSRRDLSQQSQDNIQKKISEYSHYTKDYKFHFLFCGDERNMLIEFKNRIKFWSALTGWNFLGYDWKYIINRMKMLGVPYLDISPSGTWDKFSFKNDKFSVECEVPLHKIVYDYMLIWGKWDQSIKVKESYTLDWVSEQVLGIRKVPHNMGFDEFYRNHFEDYVFYNAVDTILVEQMDKKLRTANVWFMMASELHTDLNATMKTIEPVHTVMVNYLYDKGKVLPDKDEKSNAADYQGAFVWPTHPGIFKFIGGTDFASLYPTTMRQHLISPETYIDKLGPAYMMDANGNVLCDIITKEPLLTKMVEVKNGMVVRTMYAADGRTPMRPEILCKYEDCTRTSSGALFRITDDAILPNILTEKFAKRKGAKNHKKGCNTEYEKLLHILEQREKIGGRPLETVTA